MTEIKFKAINKANNKILIVDSIEFRKEGIMVFVLCKNGKTREGFWVGCDCELLRYTGLEDKNGKEIFEGDIVKCVERPPMGCEPILSSIGLTHEVKFDSVWITPFDQFPYLDCKIIGNIYENPNLLK